jgi:hypothetical protein
MTGNLATIAGSGFMWAMTRYQTPCSADVMRPEQMKLKNRSGHLCTCQTGAESGRPDMGENRLPLEQRIGSVRDGEVTDHGTPIGSTPLAVQPPRKPDIVDRLRSEHYHIDRDGFNCISCGAADEIERLRAAGDAVAAHLADRIPAHWSVSSYVLLGAWREARHG